MLTEALKEIYLGSEDKDFKLDERNVGEFIGMFKGVV
jgi:hypothetical protein